jgi:hypothetical protein
MFSLRLQQLGYNVDKPDDDHNESKHVVYIDKTLEHLK